MPTLPCGCRNNLDTDSQVLRCQHKCARHRRQRTDIHNVGLRYYTDGCTNCANGVPQSRRYIKELTDSLAFMNVELPRCLDRSVLEVGCGIGQYAPYFLSLGYSYLGLEPNTNAATFARAAFYVDILEITFEELRENTRYDVVFSAHLLEHLLNAPDGVRKMYRLLRPGGIFLTIVPDDADLANYDHWWFFTESSLLHLLQSSGFEDGRAVTRRIVDKENFIYAFARKPTDTPDD